MHINIGVQKPRSWESVASSVLYHLQREEHSSMALAESTSILIVYMEQRLLLKASTLT